MTGAKGPELEFKENLDALRRTLKHVPEPLGDVPHLLASAYDNGTKHLPSKFDPDQLEIIRERLVLYPPALKAFETLQQTVDKLQPFKPVIMQSLLNLQIQALTSLKT